MHFAPRAAASCVQDGGVSTPVRYNFSNFGAAKKKNISAGATALELSYAVCSLYSSNQSRAQHTMAVSKVVVGDCIYGYLDI